MNCPSCGSSISNISLFCPYCRKRISVSKQISTLKQSDWIFYITGIVGIIFIIGGLIVLWSSGEIKWFAPQEFTEYTATQELTPSAISAYATITFVQPTPTQTIGILVPSLMPSQTFVTTATFTPIKPPSTPTLINFPPSPTIYANIYPLTGSGLVQLSFSNSDEYTPSLSWDQKRLVYATKINNRWQIVEADPNTGEVRRQITDGSANYYTPRLSHDGQLLLVSSDRNGDEEIYLINPQTGDIVSQLTNSSGRDYASEWLPGDVGIFFNSTRNGLEDVYMAFFEGVSLRKQIRMTKNSAFDGYASVSPDGEMMVFYSSRDGNYEIYSIDISLRTEVRLTNNPARDADPIYSPDGKWIIFESDRSGNYELYAMRLDGSGLKNLTNNPSDDQVPIFSPDGHWLLFQSKRSGNYDIFRIPWQ